MLLALPAELIDIVIENLDEPCQLAALAAVCKSLKERISPASGKELGLLQCCYLSVSPSDEVTFAKLAGTRKLARRVQRFRIHESHCPAPSHYWNEWKNKGSIPHYNLSLTRASLLQMRKLEFLSCEMPFSALTAWNESLKDLSAYCPSLQELCLKLLCNDSNRSPNRTTPPFLVLDGLRGLHALTIQLDGYDMPSIRTVHETFWHMLCTAITNNLPSLLHLSLSWFHYDSRHLLNIRLPLLLSLFLRLKNDVSLHDCDDLHELLQRHPTIRHLKLDKIYTPLRGRTSDDVLPALREIRMYGNRFGDLMPIFLPLSTGNCRPLHFVHLFGACKQYILSDHVSPSLSRTLTGLSIGDAVRQDRQFIERLAEALPNLQYLYGHWGYETFPIYAFPQAAELEVLLFLCRTFPKLRSVQKFFLSRFPDWRVEFILVDAGKLSATLNCVDDWVRTSDNSWHQDRTRARQWKWGLMEEDDRATYGYSQPLTSFIVPRPEN